MNKHKRSKISTTTKEKLPSIRSISRIPRIMIFIQLNSFAKKKKKKKKKKKN